MAPPVSSKKIFISHAAIDKDLVDKIVECLSVGAGIDVHNDVFCSSLEGIGIPPGEDFKHFIKDQIQEPELVILIISQNYLASPFCLAELGASWAMSHHMIPLLVPPVTYADLKAVLSNVTALMIEDASAWNEALEMLKRILHIAPRINLWERKRDTMITAIKILLRKQKQPPTVPIKQWNESEAKLKEANGEIIELEEEIRRLKRILEETQKLKNEKQAAEIVLKHLPAAVAFQQFVDEAAKVLESLPHVVRNALYYHFRGQPLAAPTGGMSDREEQWAQIREAVENDYLFEDDGPVTINEKEPKVRDALYALQALDAFIRDNSQLKGAYEAQYGHQLSFTSKQFWDKHL